MSEFDKYILQGEPSKKAKASAWQTAIGLQGLFDAAQQMAQKRYSSYVRMSKLDWSAE